MNIPNYSDPSAQKSKKELMDQFIAAVTSVERAIAHLLEAEAEKVQVFLRAYSDASISPTDERVLHFQARVAKVVEGLAEKQRVLMKVLELVTELLEHGHGQEGDNDEE